METSHQCDKHSTAEALVKARPGRRPLQSDPYGGDDRVAAAETLVKKRDDAQPVYSLQAADGEVAD